MSFTKKLLLSIGGSFIGHVALFFLIAGLLLFAVVTGPLGVNSLLAAETEPKEITISFSDFLEKVEVVPLRKTELEREKAEIKKPIAAKKEPDPPEKKPEPAPERRGFVETFAEHEIARPNEDARFESDRNTAASSADQPKPDPDALKNIPNQNGKDLPFVMLRDQQFVDGEIRDQENSNPSQMSAAPPQVTEANENPTPETPPKKLEADGPKQDGGLIDPNESEETPEEIAAAESMKADADLADKPQTVPENAQPKNPSNADVKPTNPGDIAAQPDAREIAPDPRMAEAQKSFVVPGRDGSAIISDKNADREQTALAQRREEKIGPPTQLETPHAASSAIPIAATAPPNPESSQPIQLPSLQPDTGAFAPEMTTTNVKGTLSNLKKSASFDAEKTPLGLYKKAVHQAIGQKWHRYRQAKADFMKWGTMKIKFRIDKNGDVKDLQLVENKANTIMAEFTLKAIQDADIPKMPAAIAELLGERGLPIEYDIFIH